MRWAASCGNTAGRTTGTWAARIGSSTAASRSATTADRISSTIDCVAPRADEIKGEATRTWSHAQDDEIDQMHTMFARIGKEEYPVEDISAEDWLRSQARCSLLCAAELGHPDTLQRLGTLLSPDDAFVARLMKPGTARHGAGCE